MAVKCRMVIHVRGRTGLWGFPFYGDPEHIDQWRADGLDIVIVENSFPGWIANLGLQRIWCFFQDVLSFRSPFK